MSTAPEKPEIIEPSETNQNSVEPAIHRPEVRVLLARYWRRNVLIMTALMATWASVSLGCGVLLAGWLNQFRLPGTGFPLGFWFAHQGAIVTFVILTLTYAVLMNRLDNRHHGDLKELNHRNHEGEEEKANEGEGEKDVGKEGVES